MQGPTASPTGYCWHPFLAKPAIWKTSTPLSALNPGLDLRHCSPSRACLLSYPATHSIVPHGLSPRWSNYITTTRLYKMTATILQIPGTVSNTVPRSMRVSMDTNPLYRSEGPIYSVGDIGVPGPQCVSYICCFATTMEQSVCRTKKAESHRIVITRPTRYLVWLDTRAL